MKKMIAVCLLAAACVTTNAQEMKVVDSATTFKQLAGPLERGTLIKTSNFHFYEINDKVSQKSGWPAQPEVIVYQEGKKYKMKIQGIEKLIAVNKIQEVIESNIAGDFKGYDGTSSFKLQNGQNWEQAETTSNVFSNLFRPAVTIYLTAEGYRMKIEGLNESPILVKKK